MREIPHPAAEASQPSWGQAARLGLAVYIGTGLIVSAGVRFGQESAARGCVNDESVKTLQFTKAIMRWDALWYEKIATDGYTYAPGVKSTVAFFPAYPLTAGLLAAGLKISAGTALLIVSQFCSAASFIVMARYAYARLPRETAAASVLAYGLLPNTFFFRMPYSESMFVLLAITSLYSSYRRWPWLVTALIVGAATAARPVGVALLPIVMAQVARTAPVGLRLFARGALAVAVGSWGLIAYAGYQAAAFGTPVAFADTQQCWSMRLDPHDDVWDKLHSLETCEPVWTVLDASSNRHWSQFEPSDSLPVFGALLFDRFFFVLAAVALGFGFWRRWLNPEEAAISALLLAIPYLTRGHEMCLFSMGRFASAAVPLYLVYGHWAVRCPGIAQSIAFAWCGVLLGFYAASFAAGRLLI